MSSTGLFALADRMKRGVHASKPLAGKTLAMIFLKSSTRTRVSFEVGAFQLGGHALFLSSATSSSAAASRSPTRRGSSRAMVRRHHDPHVRHGDARSSRCYAAVPVINGLTDLLHPCQVLADLLTVREQLGSYEGKKVAWVGDGNNMANSWLDAAYRLGFELALACPEGYDPDAAAARARAAGTRTSRVHRDPREARGRRARREHRRVGVDGSGGGAGRPGEGLRRLHRRCEAHERSGRGAIFLHCLPAHRGEEVAAEVIDGPQSACGMRPRTGCTCRRRYSRW